MANKSTSMENLVSGYNDIMNDPEKAKAKYGKAIKDQGRAQGKWNGRDATDLTVKKWPKDNMPV